MSEDEVGPGPTADATSDPWGRVDEHGTVYVRAADGSERAVGSWQAGSVDEALDFYRRRYEGLVVEVELLANRLRGGSVSAADARSALQRLRAAVREANAVGDLDALRTRLDELGTVVDQQREQARSHRAEELARAREAKTELVSEAERIAGGQEWRAGPEQLRALVERWKALPRLDKRADDELWQRFSTARSSFSKHRRAHHSELDRQRAETRERKEALVTEAEGLQGSTAWGPTAGRFRDLMTQWKAAGRASREEDDALWGRFRAAQDAFFAARNAVFAERNSAERDNLSAKEAVLGEAEAILPVRDPRAARAALRAVTERWSAAGPVPREARGGLEARFGAVEQAVRTAEESRQRRTNPEARARADTTATQLRALLADLSRQRDAALARGDARAAAEAEEAIAARQAWLAEAERVLADYTPD